MDGRGLMDSRDGWSYGWSWWMVVMDGDGWS